MGAELSTAAVLALIAGMAVTNFALRAIPLTLLSRVDPPEIVRRWLSFVPISVMGALVASEVLFPGGATLPPLSNPGIPAAVVAALTFRLSRSFLGATMAGVITYVLLRALL